MGRNPTWRARQQVPVFEVSIRDGVTWPQQNIHNMFMNPTRFGYSGRCNIVLFCSSEKEKIKNRENFTREKEKNTQYWMKNEANSRAKCT